MDKIMSRIIRLLNTAAGPLKTRQNCGNRWIKSGRVGSSLDVLIAAYPRERLPLRM